MATVSIKRQYTDFAGVDFKNNESMVNLNRSPDALNVYKDYLSSGICIQTRPGFRKIGKIGNKINGIFIYKNTKAIVHSGNKLFLWSNFPDTPEISVLKEDMNNTKTCFFILNDKVYINDGLHYLVFDGTLRDVTADAFVPTTTISRSPAGRRNRVSRC